jgi:hypothetical protein
VTLLGEQAAKQQARTMKKKKRIDVENLAQR